MDQHNSNIQAKEQRNLRPSKTGVILLLTGLFILFVFKLSVSFTSSDGKSSGTVTFSYSLFWQGKERVEDTKEQSAEELVTQVDVSSFESDFSQPPPPTSPKLDSAAFEHEVAMTLSCNKKRRIDNTNTNLFYSSELKQCVPLPSKQGWPGLEYENPPDHTSVSLLNLHLPTGQLIATNDSKISIKYSPSMHSRFLFDDWRLWESEMCSATDFPDDETEVVNITTTGFHNPALPNTIYQLDSFCVDELGGGLYGFQEDGKQGEPMPIKPHQGQIEHPYGGEYIDFDRLIDPTNREPVPIVTPTTSATWKDTVSASLERHFMKKPGGSPPEVLFVREPAMIVALNTHGTENPIHQYHRYASSVALGSILNVSTFLYLMSMAADDPKYHFHRHSSKIHMLESTSMIGKIPSRLRTQQEEEVYRRLPEPKEYNRTLRSLNDVINLPWEAADRLPSRPNPRGPLDATKMAFHEMMGKLNNMFSYYGHHGSSSLSGADGCEDYRCSSEPPTCSPEFRRLHRRCAKPFAVIANTLPNVQQINMTKVKGNLNFPNHEPFPELMPYMPDTFNYSRDVWSIGVTELMREAKRIRRDVLLTVKGEEMPVDNELKRAFETHKNTKKEPLGKYQYVALWRERLVRLLAEKINPLPQYDQSFLAMEFAEELLSVLLERNHILEQKGSLKMPWKTDRRQLICYKRAYVSHVFYRHKPDTITERGSLGMLVPANCNTREVLNITTDTIFAKYGMCTPRLKGKETTATGRYHERQHDTNRDAHPLFTLDDASREILSSLFISTKRLQDIAINHTSKLIEETINMPDSAPSNRSTSVTLLLRDLMGKIDDLQKIYDNAFMSFFSNHQSNSRRPRGWPAGRPLRLLFAQRSYKRPFQQLSISLSKLLGDGIGKYIDFEFAEGLRTEMYPLNDPLYDLKKPMLTPRARQQHTILTADMLMGPHGAELHMLATMKPSALAVEIAVAGYDAILPVANSGFFTPLAFGKNIGYLKIMAHSVEPGAQSYLSIPEMRQTMSTSFCSWLAFNAVRLTDEDKANRKSFVDYSYLTPWWCRGGPVAIIKSIAQSDALKKAFQLPRFASFINSSTAQTGIHHDIDSSFTSGGFSFNAENNLLGTPRMAKMMRAAMSTNFYNRAAAPSGFGFTYPNCPVFEPHLSFNNNSITVGSIDHPKFSRDHLNMLPKMCSSPISVDAHGPIPIKEAAPEDLLSPAGRMKSLALQSLLEVALDMDSAHASLAGRLMVQGARAAIQYEYSHLSSTSVPPDRPQDQEYYDNSSTFATNADSGITNNSGIPPLMVCGELPLNITAEHDVNTIKASRCLKAMLKSLMTPMPHERATAKNVDSTLASQADIRLGSDLSHLFDLLKQTATKPFYINDAALRESISDWAVKEFFAVPARPARKDLESIMDGDEFSYGFNCSQYMP